MPAGSWVSRGGSGGRAGSASWARAKGWRAAWLHDALRDAPAADELAHGPMAADLAARDGEADPGVLDAVRYHSLGSARWDDVGRMLYLADYLEPGRGFDRAERAALAARIPGERHAVLVEVVRRRDRKSTRLNSSHRCISYAVFC